MNILTPDRRDARQLLISLAGAFERRRKMNLIGRNGCDHDMDLRRAERFFPVFRAVLTGVAEHLRPCGHSLLEFHREAVEGILSHTERLETLKGQGKAHPGIANRAFRVCRRGHEGTDWHAASTLGHPRSHQCVTKGRFPHTESGKGARLRSECRPAPV
jgi:hypothetical protein